jgi:hypothetical protein
LWSGGFVPLVILRRNVTEVSTSYDWILKIDFPIGKSDEFFGIQTCLSIVDLERSFPVYIKSCTAAACPTCTLHCLIGCGQIAFESVG